MSSRKKAAIIAPPRGASHRGFLNRPITADGAVVFTVSVVVVVGVIEEEASEQELSVIDAGTVQVKLILPVNPLRAVALIVVVPDAPGAEMLNEVGFATTLKLGAPLVMVTV